MAKELCGRIAQEPAAFDMMLTLSNAGDDLNDLTTAWPDNRQRVTVGRLTVTEVAPGPGGSTCEQGSFLAPEDASEVEFSGGPTCYAPSHVKRIRPHQR